MMGQDMLLTEEKLERRLAELCQTRYRNVCHIESFHVSEDVSGMVNPPLPNLLNDKSEILSVGERWQGRDRYLWLQKKILLPSEWMCLEGIMEPVGVFDFGITGSGYNSGFESMIYIDGEPYQSVDTNHKEVFFKKEHIGRELIITFRLWSGLEGGGAHREMEHRFNSAFVGLLDVQTDDLFYTGDAMLRTVQVLKEEQLERHELLRALDASMTLIDWTDKGSDEFYENVIMANEKLQSTLNKMYKNTKATVSCVGHTHIDTAWMWRLRHTIEKASRSFSTVLRYMERYPEYFFLHTQPQQYAFIKEYFPEIYRQIRERVREGRWEIDGAMWVEPDCNLPSGESLTRQILQGRKFMLEEFGKEPEYLWLPDVFGYSYALPQILKKSGIHTFMTTKIAWNQYNRMPNDTFWWKGLDGSEVLAHFITTPSLGQDVETNFYSNYNGHILPESIVGSWKLYREKHINPETLVSYGYGDGGGGVTRDMLEYRRRLDRIPGLPNVKTSRAGDFFRRLQDKVASTDELMATWDGEMYLEYHRGTYTSQAYVKKMNRRMEELYRKTEWLTSMYAIQEKDLSKASQDILTEGWRIILTHQFHDIIPGSSISEVYEDAALNYAKAGRIASEVIKTSIKELTKDTETPVYSILNVLQDTRSGLVKIADDKKELLKKAFYTAEGNKVPTQRVEDGVLVHVKDVPAMGVKYLYLRDDVDEKANFNDEPCSEVTEKDGGLCLITSFYSISLDRTGQIISLYDKENSCEVIAKGKRGNVFQFFEDKPLEYDAWDIDMYYCLKQQDVTNLICQKIVENGPLRTVLRQEWKISKSSICQDMILYKDNRRIDFKTHVNWQETQKLLKVAFPVDIRTTYATYDIQYGNIRRANHSNSSWERAKFEVVGHRFADLSEHGYGVSLLNDCKYGYDIHQNVMRLTLLKAAIWPDTEADKGEHDFTYALYPHKNGFVEGGTVCSAADLNQSLEVLKGRIVLPTDKQGSTISITGTYVEIDAFKKSEDGQSFIVRFHEYAGAKGMANIHFGFPVKEVCECDLMERKLEDLRLENEHNIQMLVRPYEIKSLQIKI